MLAGTPSVPTPNPNSGTYIEDLTERAESLKQQLAEAEGAGYTGSEEIQYNKEGKVIPKTVGTSDVERAKKDKKKLIKLKRIRARY